MLFVFSSFFLFTKHIINGGKILVYIFSMARFIFKEGDLSINYVGALERAEKNLTVTNLINIANVLGVTADMLLCDEIRIGYKIKSSMITEKIEKLSPSDRDKIIQMLDIMLGEK